MKILCPPGYHHNVFVATHTIGHMIEGYRLLLLMNQRLLYKPVKERNVSSHKWSTTQILLKFHRRFITTMASWQPLHLGRWYTIIYTLCTVAYMLCPSCFWKIWTLCVSWITYDLLYYAPCNISNITNRLVCFTCQLPNTHICMSFIVTDICVCEIIL